MCQVREVSRVHVYGRDEEKRKQFAAEMSRECCTEVVPVGSPGPTSPVSPAGGVCAGGETGALCGQATADLLQVLRAHHDDVADVRRRGR